MRSSISQRAFLKRGWRAFIPAALIIAASTIGIGSQAVAADASRDALIRAAEMAYLKSAVFTPDSPMMDALLAPAKAANPDVSDDVWAGVKADTGSAITSVMFGPGSAVETTMHQSLDKLSNPELQHLTVLLSDPVMIKFQQLMADPSTQRELMQGLMGSTVKMQAAVNGVLVRHGLKVPGP
ncbi:hypothetical protein EKH79_09205 [Dyella dinghuensis]|uniref:Uncharacterized protein n=1 Tax=Dyella dinghuensis TaxID=1920169 RepID=A0A3S0PF44_9GAMM|nr:hypothetical protein [Dyella dinghuensis]RUL64218.1 hypothetical protein EKH79_09205 [Dyella dinghuensis]